MFQAHKPFLASTPLRLDHAVRARDLHPLLHTAIDGEHKNVSWFCRLMVGAVAASTSQPVNSILPEDILTPQMEKAVREFARSRKNGDVSPAKRLVRKLGNESLYLERCSTIVDHPLLQMWVDSEGMAHKANCLRFCSRFLKWLCESLEFQSVKPESFPVALFQRRHFERYRLYLMKRTRGDLEHCTAKRYLSGVLRWVRWLIENRYVGKIELVGIKLSDSQNQERMVASDDDCLKLLDALRSKPWWGQYELFFLLLMATGARPCEIHKLIVADINYQSHCVWLISKGGKGRWFPVAEHLWNRLTVHVSMHVFVDPNSRIFVNSQGHPFSIDSIRNVFNHACRVAGVRINGQMAFRHKVATELLENGAGLRETIYLMGQSDSSQLIRYQHVQGRYPVRQQVSDAFRSVIGGE